MSDEARKAFDEYRALSWSSRPDDPQAYLPVGWGLAYLPAFMAGYKAGAEANRADAERYRWLREETSDLSFMFDLSRKGKPIGILARELLDAAIDSALGGRTRVPE